MILVPEHLVPDAKAQVFRYCLNLNFREEYRVYDDIFALLHDDVQLGSGGGDRFRRVEAQPAMKKIFITSFNLFKKALTYDNICAKASRVGARLRLVWQGHPSQPPPALA